jgi:hypothetical protein
VSPTTRPVFDPEVSLGWQGHALDGLNCVLRCVEAVLRFRGLTPREVARALNGPLDPVDRDVAIDFDGCRVDWQYSKDAGERNVPMVLRALSVGEPLVVMPDRFYVPDDVYRGRFHFHDHALLAVGWDPEDRVVRLLDTDADPADEFTRRWELTAELEAMFTQVATVSITDAPDRREPGEYLAARLDRDTARLHAGVAAVAELLETLRDDGLDLVTARALHVFALGDLQPLFFLFANALRVVVADGADPGERLTPDIEAVHDAALTARNRAMRLGVALIAAHERPDPLAEYPRVMALAPALVAAMQRLVQALIDAGGQVGPPDPAAVDRLRARFAHIENVCFPVGEDAPW